LDSFAQAELLELVAIPSISSLPQHQPDIALAADWLVARLHKAGFQVSDYYFVTQTRPLCLK
jgi:acetylornithine deacetylase/succinyl-diaminopimelate desuccinylase-like protein